MSTSKTPEIILTLESADDGQDRHPQGHNGSCRPHVVICPGYGDKDFPFPNSETLVVRALSRMKQKNQDKQAKHVALVEAENDGDDGKEEDQPDPDAVCSNKIAVSESQTCACGEMKPARGFDDECHSSHKSGVVSSRKKGAHSLIPQTKKARENGIDGTLFVAAAGLRELLEDGKYDAIVAERFDDLVDKVNWARDHMDAKYAPAVKSLSNQLTRLRQVYLAALPRVLDGLRAQQPNVSEGRLLDAAIEVLDEELTQILAVLRIWTDAFGQQRSGKYRELDAVVFAVEQAFHLFEGNDLNASVSAEVINRLKTRVFKVGNVFVARFSGEGPATLPGTRGPVGAHAMEVPHDERNFITLMLVLYMHEFRHDIFHDVEGLGTELTAVVAQALRNAFNDGELVLSRETVNIGRQRVSLLNLLIKMYADTIGEVDADISGGVLLAGPAFLYNMVMTFSAFNARRRGVFNVSELLRTSSYYEYRQLENGQATISFLPHPPDYIRAYIVSAALDEIGFPEEAKQCRLLADQAVSFKTPEYISWSDVSGEKGRPQIKIPVEDLKKAAPIVARALLNSQLKSLGDVSTGEVLQWTKERQEKADYLAELLMEGKGDLPDDKGHIHVTYVIAAASLAYWGLCKSGMQPRYAARLIEDNALKMIDQVRERFQQAQLEALARAQAEAEAKAKDASEGQDTGAEGTAEGVDKGAAEPGDGKGKA
jgi:hypothetical protein